MRVSALPTLPECLADTELFAELTAIQLADVLAEARVRHLDKGTTVFVQGTRIDRAHVLLRGRIRILQTDEDGAQVVVRFIGPGETFGTMGLFADHLYPAHAVTVTDCTEMSWAEASFLSLIARYPTIALNLVRVIGARLKEAQDRLREFSTQRVERRVAHALVRLAAQAGPQCYNETTIDFPLSRKDLAEMCGTTLHTVSRILTVWEKEGTVSTYQQRITIRDLSEIRHRAEQSS